jgi:5'-3' exonuclease
MGIDKFHTWLKQKYSGSMMNFSGKSFDHLYIDLNFMLHRLVMYTPTEDELIERIIQTIKESMCLNKPRKTITLVADGSASYAKIMLQKENRLRTVQSMKAKLDQINSIECAFEEEIVEVNKKDIKDLVNTVNPLLLTPGTDFMNKFGQRIKDFAKQLKLHVHISLADEPDESELKICRFVQDNASDNETHLIQSNDADIILIGLALVNVKGVNVMVQHNSIDESYIISIDKLVDVLMNKVLATTKIKDLISYFYQC